MRANRYTAKTPGMNKSQSDCDVFTWWHSMDENNEAFSSHKVSIHDESDSPVRITPATTSPSGEVLSGGEAGFTCARTASAGTTIGEGPELRTCKKRSWPPGTAVKAPTNPSIPVSREPNLSGLRSLRGADVDEGPEGVGNVKGET
ncbi:unnamed protein product [Lampetra fluviatilis]